MKRFVLPGLCIILSSCAAAPVASKPGFFADTPVGSTLTVNQPLTIPANEVRASLQFSKQTRMQELDKWEPYCQLVVKTLIREEKHIPAMDFRITRVVRDEEPFTRLKKSRRLMIASADENFSILSFGGPSYTWLIKTYMYLESDEYPDIYRMVCGQVWDGYSSRQLYMSEFEEAVGDFISIRSSN
jgi:hypothetical protein